MHRAWLPQGHLSAASPEVSPRGHRSKLSCNVGGPPPGRASTLTRSSISEQCRVRQSPPRSAQRVRTLRQGTVPCGLQCVGSKDALLHLARSPPPNDGQRRMGAAVTHRQGAWCVRSKDAPHHRVRAVRITRVAGAEARLRDPLEKGVASKDARRPTPGVMAGRHLLIPAVTGTDARHLDPAHMSRIGIDKNVAGRPSAGGTLRVDTLSTSAIIHGTKGVPWMIAIGSTRSSGTMHGTRGVPWMIAFGSTPSSGNTRGRAAACLPPLCRTMTHQNLTHVATGIMTVARLTVSRLAALPRGNVGAATANSRDLVPRSVTAGRPACLPVHGRLPRWTSTRLPPASHVQMRHRLPQHRLGQRSSRQLSLQHLLPLRPRGRTGRNALAPRRCGPSSQPTRGFSPSQIWIEKAGSNGGRCSSCYRA